MPLPSLSVPRELALALHSASRIVVLTGAGVSAESGVPTFRDAQTGLWAKINPMDLASPAAFERDPRLVWEWYAHRRQVVSAATPNPGHYALAAMEKRVKHFTLVTQNVDGLHQKSGSRSVLELHGSILRARCSREQTPVDSWIEGEEVPPRCPRCGAFLRPDVVWFGENLPEGIFDAAARAAESCDLLFSVGTSALVQPAASLPLSAKRGGACLVEINPKETCLTGSADFFLQGPSGKILPGLLQYLADTDVG